MEYNITINFADHIDFDNLEKNVIREIADICTSKLTGGHTESFHKMCVSAIEIAISEKIGAKVEELISRPISPRDRFGDPIRDADAKSLSDMLADAVEMACEETVDRDGKPAKATTWSKAIPRIQWHLAQIAAREIDAEAAKAIKELKADAKEKVRQQIAVAVAAQLAKG